MLLKLLYDLAHSRKLLDDLAFTPKNIRWIIPLDREGNLIGSGLQTLGKKNRGMEYSVPQTTRPKVAGGIAEFLTDGITAIFGIDSDPEKDIANEKKRNDRNRNNKVKWQDFWSQIKTCYKESKHPSLYAMRRFYLLNKRNKIFPIFLRWGINQKPKPKEKLNPCWWVMTASGEEIKLGADNFMFKVDGLDDLPINDEKILRPYWRKVFQNELEILDCSAQRGICLITGDSDVPIAATHHIKIKGVPETQSFGASIVSFDKPAFTSYGFDQSHNAPSSTLAAMAYSIALNYLLSQEDHHLRVGQTSVCFWAKETKEASSFFAQMLNRPDPARVASFLREPWLGIDREFVRHDQFYSVTLSGNSGRIVVRHWMQTTLEQARKNLIKWFSDLEIVTYGFVVSEETGKQKNKISRIAKKDAPPPLALYSLASSTVRETKNLQAETLSGLYRASLEGIAPPPMLLQPILNRLNADICRFGTGILETPISAKAMKAIVNSKTPIPPPGQSRMALLRMILNRNSKEGNPMIEPQVFETDDPAYNCGRLLAVFDDLQMKAHEYKLEGSGVVERYYGTACSSPNSAFGILWRLHQHHLKKVSKQGEKGKRDSDAIKRSIAKIASLFQQPAPNIPPQFPRTFNLQEQGRFALGFYQQKAADDAARQAHKPHDNQL